MARTRTVLGLDIGTFSVCAVELTGNRDSVQVTGVGWERIPSPDLLEDTILAVISDNGLDPKALVTSVSGRSVIMRYVNMMSMPAEELESAVYYEANKYIPWEVEDVQLSCQQLGGVDERGQMRVLIVAAKRDLVDEHVSMLSRLKLRPSIIDVDHFALGNAFELCNQSGELAGEDEAVALVDIGASKTCICIYRGNSEIFTRPVFTAGESITDAIARRFGEEPADVELMKWNPGDAEDVIRESMLPVLEEIGSEARLSFDYYENQFERPISRVYVSGGSVQFAGVVSELGRIFEVETVRFTPFEMLDVRTDNDVVIREKASDMVVALGLASRIRGM